MFSVFKFILKAILLIGGAYVLFILGSTIFMAAGLIACVVYGLFALFIAIFIAWKTRSNKAKDGSYDITGKNYSLKKTVERDANKEKTKTTFKFGNWSGEETFEKEFKFDK